MKSTPSVLLFWGVLNPLLVVSKGSGRPRTFRYSNTQTEDDVANAMSCKSFSFISYQTHSSVLGFKEKSGTPLDSLTLTMDAFSTTETTYEDVNEAAKLNVAVVERLLYNHDATKDEKHPVVSSKELYFCRITDGNNVMVHYLNKFDRKIELDELQCGDERWLFDPFTEDFMYTKGLEEEVQVEKQKLITKTLAAVSGVPTSSLKVTGIFCKITALKLLSLSKLMEFGSLFDGVCLGYRKTIRTLPKRKREQTTAKPYAGTEQEPILILKGISSESKAAEEMSNRVWHFNTKVNTRSVHKYKGVEMDGTPVEASHTDVTECHISLQDYSISLRINDQYDTLKMSELKCGSTTYSYDIFDEVLSHITSHCDPDTGGRVYLHGAGRCSTFLAHVKNGRDMSKNFCDKISMKLHQLSRAMGYASIFHSLCPAHHAMSKPIVGNIEDELSNVSRKELPC